MHRQRPSLARLITQCVARALERSVEPLWEGALAAKARGQAPSDKKHGGVVGPNSFGQGWAKRPNKFGPAGGWAVCGSDLPANSGLNHQRGSITPHTPVIPANAGIQCLSGNPATPLGSRIRGSDEVDCRQACASPFVRESMPEHRRDSIIHTPVIPANAGIQCLSYPYHAGLPHSRK